MDRKYPMIFTDRKYPMVFLTIVTSLLLTWPADVIRVASAASRRSDDASFQALMTMVQHQAETIERQETSLQALQNQLLLLQQTVSNQSAVLSTVSSRLDTQVFFTAHTSTYNVNMGSNSPIRFDTVVTNIGTAYNPATGIFTAPVTGVYVFYAQLMKHAETNTIHWGIAQSGTYLCMNSADPPNSYDKASVWPRLGFRKAIRFS